MFLILDSAFWILLLGVVGEHSAGLRRCTARYDGGGRGEYAGISSAKADEKSARRKPKVSWGRQIRPG